MKRSTDFAAPPLPLFVRFAAMPYICALFDPSVSESIQATANSIASGSSFVPLKDYHVPLLGSLHVYSEEAVAEVIQTAPGLHGRFLKWELHAGVLRATVTLDDSAALLALHNKLPRGRPWRSHYVALGSIDIEATQHTQFLEAVAAAFPMSSDVIFTTSCFEYRNNVSTAATPRTKNPGKLSKAKLNAKAAPPKRKLNPQAAPFESGRPPAASFARSIRGAIGKHLKWSRKQDATARALTVDELIKSTGR